MADAEIDVLEDIQEPEPESGTTSPGQDKSWVFPLVGAVFLVFAVILLFFNKNANDVYDTGPSEAFLTYTDLSNETHTGLRLAKLDDFIAQYSDSANIDAAKARRNALKLHEEKAWANLTNTYYDAEANETVKAQAIKLYTDVWTPLHRPQQLKTLSQVLPNDAVPNFNPNDRKSRFASGGNDQFLEGAPVSRQTLFQRTFNRNTKPERTRPGRSTAPRIRGTARKPSYPRNARRRRVEANVVLALDIDDNGRVARTHLVSVNADRYAKDFVKAAKRAARRTRFYPKTVNGRPVSSSGHIQKYAFRNTR